MIQNRHTHPERTAIYNKKITYPTSENLAEYFLNKESGIEKISPTKLADSSGITYEFQRDGSCENDGDCKILVDTNGDKGPNELWINKDKPKDRLFFDLKIKGGVVEIISPEILFAY